MAARGEGLWGQGQGQGGPLPFQSFRERCSWLDRLVAVDAGRSTRFRDFLTDWVGTMRESSRRAASRTAWPTAATEQPHVCRFQGDVGTAPRFETSASRHPGRDVSRPLAWGCGVHWRSLG